MPARKRSKRSIEQAVLELLEARGTATACPSEIARALEPKAWRPLMDDVRSAAARLQDRGKVDVYQRGKPVALREARGPIRLRAANVKRIDHRGEPHRYRIGRGEEGVLTVEPYKSELLPFWTSRSSILRRMGKALFEGFADTKASFFVKLAKNQNKEWFVAHKEEYEEGWQRPLISLLEDVRTKLEGTYDDLDLGDPHVMRIYRDVRFSKDKSPYKTWLGGGLPLAKSPKSKMPEAPSALYFHVSPKECFGGAGMYMMDPPSLEKMRKAILDDKRGGALHALTKKLEKKGYRLAAADTLKKPPKGIDPGHERVELLKKKGLVVVFPEIPRGELTKPALVTRLVKNARECAPVVAWIAAAVL